ncbi:hypothetical protein BV25DRAFT_1817615 [Artomyces pyxidatus]|uniref:Uncharacterized protein n=1 Tax=Artomyces pyxidatus TaxID=48021 RepID=A0ACB8TJZ7_9AGAM|nr:hypothetical protein BV25DRAFT_1817615 [Artomyces pyxidatus]
MYKALLAVLSLLPPFSSALTTPPIAQQPWSLDVKVPVTLGVMSRCPDALLCEAVFDQIMPRIAHKVDFSLTYVAKVNSSEPDFGATCMHGPDECAGNVQQLCAAKYTPLKTWWEFVMCQNYEKREAIGRPDVALKCARAAGIDWETSQVGQCAGLDASGVEDEGVLLLHESIKATEALGIKKSCTVVINGEKVCVHDETWKDCDNGHSPKDFIRQIEAEYRRLNGFTAEDIEAPDDA